MKNRGKGRKLLSKRTGVQHSTNAQLQPLLSTHTSKKTVGLRLNEYKSAIEAAGDQIIRVNKDGTVVYINDRIESLLGYKLEEMEGKTFWDQPNWSADKSQEYRRAFPQFLKDLKNAKGKILRLNEVEWIHKNGSSVFVEVNVQPCIRGGKVDSLVVVIRDISVRKW